MFGWIESVLSDIGGGIESAVINLVRALIRGLYAFFHDILSAAHNAWFDVWGGVHDLWSALWNFGNAVYAKFWWILKNVIPWLINEANWIYQTLVHYVAVAYDELASYAIQLYKDAINFAENIPKWVISDIWDPIWRGLSPIVNWVTHEGATAWYYFTHLDDFAELLFWYLIHKLEKYAWDAARLLGQFFLALIVANLVQFITLIEDVINAVL